MRVTTKWLMDNMGAVSEAFPEVAADLRDLAGARCPSCKLARMAAPIMDKLNSLVSVDRPLPAGPPSTPWQDIRMPREACWNCVVKHLSRALVLIPEVANGYPGLHMELAGSLGMAAASASEEDAGPLKEAAAALRAGPAIAALSKAMGVVKGILSLDGPLSRFELIGHMVNAEEECWNADDGLAARIRDERLRVMDDPEYTPDIPTLLAAAASAGA